MAETGARQTFVDIDPQRLLIWVVATCVGLEVAFVLLDYHVNYGRLVDIGAIRRFSNIAREDGVASWFGTAQTMCVALTAWAIYVVVGARQLQQWRRVGWLVLALWFSYMTVDDGAQLHERIGTTVSILQEDAGSSALDLFPSYTWQLVFLPLFGGLGLFMAAFLWRELADRQARLAVLVAIGCLVVAVVLDFFEGLEADHAWNLYAALAGSFDLDTFTEARFQQTAYDALDHFSRSIEEFLEMFAMTLLWGVFLRHLTTVGGDLNVRFRPRSRA